MRFAYGETTACWRLYKKNIQLTNVDPVGHLQVTNWFKVARGLSLKPCSLWPTTRYFIKCYSYSVQLTMAAPLHSQRWNWDMNTKKKYCYPFLLQPWNITSTTMMHQSPLQLNSAHARPSAHRVRPVGERKECSLALLFTSQYNQCTMYFTVLTLHVFFEPSVMNYFIFWAVYLQLFAFEH